MSGFHVDELVQRMAALSLQDNSVAKTITNICTDAPAVVVDASSRADAIHEDDDTEMRDVFIISRNEIAIQEASIVTSRQVAQQSKIKKTTRKRKIPLSQTLELRKHFVRYDAMYFFAQTWESTFTAWMTLLSNTKIAPNDPLTVQGLASAVRALDNVISGKNEPYLPPRFGYVQLFDFVESLKSMIQRDKYCGYITAESHRTNAALAYEFYRNAQDTPTTTARLRRFKLVGGRWKATICSSPLLLLAFSKAAASLAEDPTKVDNRTYNQLVLNVLDDVPDKLKNVCNKLSRAAECAAAKGSLPDQALECGLRAEVGKCLGS